MSLRLENKQHFAAVGTKINAQFFESISTDKNVRTFIYGEENLNDSITQLQFVTYKELPSESNGYKNIHEDYFVLYIASSKKALWSGFIDKKDTAKEIALTNSIVCDVCKCITKFIYLLTINGYTYSHIEEKYNEWSKKFSNGTVVKIRLTLGGDCCYLAVNKGDGYKIYEFKLQTVVADKDWFIRFITP